MYAPLLSVLQQNGAAPLPQALDWVGGGGEGFGGGAGLDGLGGLGTA